MHVHCIRGVGDGLTSITATVWMITAKMVVNKNMTNPWIKLKRWKKALARYGLHVTAHLQVRFQNEISN